MAIKQIFKFAHFRWTPRRDRQRTEKYALTIASSIVHRNWSKFKALFFAGAFTALLLLPTLAKADSSALVEERPFYLGRVTIIFSQGAADDLGLDQKYQRVNVQLLGGPDKGTDHMIDYAMNASSFESQKLSVGDTVIVAKETVTSDQGEYAIMDKFRLPGVAIALIAFLILAIIFGGIRGFTSMLGLSASIAILIFGVVPAIMSGHNPLAVCLVASIVIAVVSILLAHGFNKRSYIALGATIVTLIGAIIFSFVGVWLAKLSGAGSEAAIYLQIGSLPSLNLQGLLLGAMIIGILGVLDDVTTAQVAAIEEIGIADASLDFKELYKRGLRVGREHIASLVNTLALAYAGASFPLFLIFAVQGGPPLWVVLNAEYVMEEVVRTIVGGASLVIAVPISTAFAAWYFGKHRR
jgi:uncharacterized membrane protein